MIPEFTLGIYSEINVLQIIHHKMQCPTVKEHCLMKEHEKGTGCVDGDVKWQCPVILAIYIRKLKKDNKL